MTDESGKFTKVGEARGEHLADHVKMPKRIHHMGEDNCWEVFVQCMDALEGLQYQNSRDRIIRTICQWYDYPDEGEEKTLRRQNRELIRHLSDMVEDGDKTDREAAIKLLEDLCKRGPIVLEVADRPE